MLKQFAFKALNALSTSCHYRKMSLVAKSLKYAKYGEPAVVLKIHEEEIPDPKDNEVLVKVLAAPINPSDIYTILGEYPVRPELPAVGGNEFVGKVEVVGKNVKDLKPGDRVIPAAAAIGTWRSHGVYPARNLMKVSSNVGLLEAATITVNPCTAYRMLKDFVTLKPGDTVIQNGANSAAGQAVHQLCRAWNINSVGVVRDRPDIKNVKEFLKSMGATEVFTEEEIRQTDVFRDKLKKPILALDCVGGKSSTEIARHLDTDGFHVTYGGMSKQPVMAGAAALIFKNISYVGFWITTWKKKHGKSPESEQMYAEIYKLIEEGKFTGPVHEMIPFEKYKDAVSAVLNFKGFNGKKFILDLQ